MKKRDLSAPIYHFEPPDQVDITHRTARSSINPLPPIQKLTTMNTMPE